MEYIPNIRTLGWINIESKRWNGTPTWRNRLDLQLQLEIRFHLDLPWFRWSKRRCCIDKNTSKMDVYVYDAIGGMDRLDGWDGWISLS